MKKGYSIEIAKIPNIDKDNGHIQLKQRYHLHCEACQQYYSVSTLAAMWDMSVKSVRRLIQNGTIKAKRIGGSARIAHSEIIKAINDL